MGLLVGFGFANAITQPRHGLALVFRRAHHRAPRKFQHGQGAGCFRVQMPGDNPAMQKVKGQSGLGENVLYFARNNLRLICLMRGQRQSHVSACIAGRPDLFQAPFNVLGIYLRSKDMPKYIAVVIDELVTD